MKLEKNEILFFEEYIKNNKPHLFVKDGWDTEKNIKYIMFFHKISLEMALFIYKGFCKANKMKCDLSFLFDENGDEK